MSDKVMSDEQAPEVKSRRGRRFLRLFLMVAGGLAAPCLALAAFFLSNTGGSDAPVAKSSVIQGRQVTTTTRARPPASAPIATTTTTSTTTTTLPPGPPPRDPFVPLVTQAPGH